MKIVELSGLRIAVVDPDEAVSTDWPGYGHDVGVVRVPHPPETWWPRLADAGFVRKPDRLTWLAGTGAADSDFLAGMSAKERQGIAEARRYAARAGLRLDRPEIDEELLDDFLDLYERVVAQMPNGLPVATAHRETVLGDLDRYFAVCAYGGGELRGAAIGEWCPEIHLARIRFSAVAPEHRRGSLSRVLYVDAVQAAREAGYGRVTLGNDPNLYGHLVMPGLFAFKARLGFTPVPSTSLDPKDGETVSDRVLSMKALADPSFMLAYAGADGTAEASLRFEFFSRTTGVDTRLYTTCMPAEVRIHQIDQ